MQIIPFWQVGKLARELHGRSVLTQSHSAQTPIITLWLTEGSGEGRIWPYKTILGWLTFKAPQISTVSVSSTTVILKLGVCINSLKISPWFSFLHPVGKKDESYSVSAMFWCVCN